MKKYRNIILTAVCAVSLVAIVMCCAGLTPECLGGLPVIIGTIGAAISITNLTIKNYGKEI